ncbi:hypothetical protein DFP72DRAFT_1168086 [Ephemerocybe angulata]|uniref:Mitochondrial ribosomal protein S15 n=1 Tax=Ephemerocybe angulata TaxID=980116 RepID=A0A8H6I4J1_9AGAR|nr:hypothetical protein DFP72DRAFT_1168086 [Tulosesus angulatus]
MLRTFLPTFRGFHTSSVNLASARKQASSVIRKKNILQKTRRTQEALADRPSVVLGTRPSEEAVKWPNCDLAKILVNEELLHAPNPVASSSTAASSSTLQPLETPIGEVHVPVQPAFGVAEAEKELLFNYLPRISAEAKVLPGSPSPIASGRDIVPLDKKMARAEKEEVKKADAFARVIDLRNANAAGIAFENRRRIIEAFSTPENPFDPGRAEVQDISNSENCGHILTTFRRDVGNRLGLRKLVHERAKILRYLRNTNRDRYEIVLERLALEPAAVEGELIV